MNAQERRRERRAAKQADWKSANPLLVGISAKPERITLKLNRKVDRVAKALIAQDTKYYDSADNRCLPEVAMYSAGFRKVRKDATHIVK